VNLQRPQHVLIARALRSMDASLLERSRCYFGGGTAIVLQNGEYRLSLDIDFLCADVDGYRELRNAIDRQGASAIFGPEVTLRRDVRSDQYGIRCALALGDHTIKFEIVREGRIALQGAVSADLGVPVLSIDCQFAEKLLANADRCLDRSVAYRDAIDLGYLVISTGEMPATAVAIAERAYGDGIARAMALALAQLAKPEEVEYAANALGMQTVDIIAAAAALQPAAQARWPNLTTRGSPPGR
jgi:hypothetical protein